MTFLRRASFITTLAVSCALVSVAGTGCSTASLMQFGEEEEKLPEDLARDLKDKFEVRSEEGLTPVAEGRAKDEEPSSLPTPAPPVQEVKPESSVKNLAAHAKKKPKPVATPSVFKYPNRRPENLDPIWPAERQIYDVTYLGGKAGEFSLEVLHHKYINERKVYHVKGHATSSSLFALFYKINDTVETYFDYEGLFSHRFHLQLDESKQTRNAIELYDSEKKQTYYWNRWHHHKRGYTESKDFFPIKPFSQDSLSALYYIRTLPLKNGDVYQFPVVSEGKSWTAVVTVIGRENMETPMGRISVIKVKPETKFRGVLKKRGDSFIWFTDDDRRFMVRLEAKVKIGSVVAQMKDVYKGLHPVKY